jgi:hypothetical protein
VPTEPDSPMLFGITILRFSGVVCCSESILTGGGS